MAEHTLQGLALYHFESCPYCQKVRRAMAELGLAIELRDTRQTPAYREEQISGGGKGQVPCLRIEKEGQVTWLYESDAIIDYIKAL
ncbi:glutathione S-transferase N-terminal domain-containing protein [Vibrio aphrogenes]|uniref:glutathione S-transferase N-terminal domain-containing protein n=1 Tax=Vibrio aphrogenes TaxID=1891186 RepID=UPI000B35093C|nr:glutathione S-transferase N-terminal domain-containing protein [Vibrio aphrogenes]